jgi:hypothetical protein
MRRSFVVVVLALTALCIAVAPATASAPAKKFPKNVCKLFKAAEIQALIRDADAGTSKYQAIQGVKNASCNWKSVSGEKLATLTATVLDLGSSIPPGFAKLALQHETGAHKVSGIGSFAIYTSVANIDVDVKAIVGRRTIDVEYNANAAEQQKNGVIKIAKALAKKL